MWKLYVGEGWWFRVEKHFLTIRANNKVDILVEEWALHQSLYSCGDWMIDLPDLIEGFLRRGDIGLNYCWSWSVFQLEDWRTLTPTEICLNTIQSTTIWVLLLFHWKVWKPAFCFLHFLPVLRQSHGLWILVIAVDIPVWNLRHCSQVLVVM